MNTTTSIRNGGNAVCSTGLGRVNRDGCYEEEAVILTDLGRARLSIDDGPDDGVSIDFGYGGALEVTPWGPGRVPVPPAVDSRAVLEEGALLEAVNEVLDWFCGDFSLEGCLERAGFDRAGLVLELERAIRTVAEECPLEVLELVDEAADREEAVARLGELIPVDEVTGHYGNPFELTLRARQLYRGLYEEDLMDAECVIPYEAVDDAIEWLEAHEPHEWENGVEEDDEAEDDRAGYEAVRAVLLQNLDADFRPLYDGVTLVDVLTTALKARNAL